MENVKSSLSGKLWYSIGNLGSQFCWTFMAMYISMYYTDSLGISAALVGTMMLVARIFDGISDVVFGIIIEKSNMKMGKARPWLIIASPLLAVGVYACFNVPTNLSKSGTIAFIFLSYTFVSAVAFTIYTLAFGALPSLMSRDSNDRNTIATLGMVFATLGGMILSYATPILLVVKGTINSTESWNFVSVIYAIICGALIFGMGIFVKEQPYEAAAKEKEDFGVAEKEKVAVSSLLKIILSNKYTWILMLIFLLHYAGAGMASLLVYFWKDCIGKFNLYGTSAMVVNFIMLVCLFACPKLFERFGKKRTIQWGLFLSIIFQFTWIFLSKSIPGSMVCLIIKTIGTVPETAAIYGLIADVVDNVYEKHHVRTDSILSMSASVGTKVGTGLGTAIVGWGLAAIGYDGTLAVQSEATIKGIGVINGVIPGIVYLVLFIAISAWNIDKSVKNK